MFIYRAIAGDCASYEEDKRVQSIKNSKVCLKWTIFISLLAIFTGLMYACIPTKKDALLIIAGGGALEYLTNDSTGKQIPKELSTFVISELKSASSEAIKEIKVSDVKEKVLDDAKKMSPTELLNKIKTDSSFAKIVLEK